MSRKFSLIVTCEHGGNCIPAAYQTLFADAATALESHRGWDPGALELAQRISQRLRVPVFSSTTSRLLVELNRSPRHPKLFSHWMAGVASAARQQILAQYYHPYREQVTAAIRQQQQAGKPVLHLSVHSFTPVLGEEVRTADVGLLYDPRRRPEQEFCLAWQQELRAAQPTWRVRRNYPYRGAADGFTTALRRLFPAESYVGIELEITQAWPLGEPQLWRRQQLAMIESLASLLES